VRTKGRLENAQWRGNAVDKGQTGECDGRRGEGGCGDKGKTGECEGRNEIGEEDRRTERCGEQRLENAQCSDSGVMLWTKGR